MLRKRCVLKQFIPHETSSYNMTIFNWRLWGLQIYFACIMDHHLSNIIKGLVFDLNGGAFQSIPPYERQICLEAMERVLKEGPHYSEGEPFPDTQPVESVMLCSLIYGSSELVRRLLLIGISKDPLLKGARPLFWAAVGGNPEMVKVLVEGGSDIEKGCAND